MDTDTSMDTAIRNELEGCYREVIKWEQHCEEMNLNIKSNFLPTLFDRFKDRLIGKSARNAYSRKMVAWGWAYAHIENRLKELEKEYCNRCKNRLYRSTKKKCKILNFERLS